jgi:hypothetical protein
MAMEFRNYLQKVVGAKHPIPSTIAFDYPNVDALVIKIASLLQIDIIQQVQSKDIGESKINKMDQDEVESEINKIISKMVE